MVIEELKQHCIRQIAEFERFKEILPVSINDYKHYEEHKMVLQLIEAWEKVKIDIQEEENILYHDCEADFSKSFDVIRVDTVLEIINKHLKEVEK